MSRNRELRSGGRGSGGPTTAEVLRRLELTVTRKLDGMLQGDYLGLVPGHGTELAETRAYVPGDDVRRIDWNVTARYGDVHVRETTADRELETWLLVDLSASLDFGTTDCEKRDLAVAAAAAVGFLTARTGNRLGGVLLTSSGTVTVPARSGRLHLRSFLHQVLEAPRGDGGGSTELGPAMTRLARIARRGGLVVVISDFLAADDWARSLRAVASRSDVLAVEVIDPRELRLPSVGLLQIVDPETGRHHEIPTGNAKLRQRYEDAARAQRQRIRDTIRGSGADHVVLRTDQDWLLDLVRFVTVRRRRLERSGLSRA